MIEDLIKVSSDLAEKRDASGAEQAEAILSRYLAELDADFELELLDKYLQSARFLDPKVHHRTFVKVEPDDSKSAIKKEDGKIALTEEFLQSAFALYTPKEIEPIEDQSTTKNWKRRDTVIVSGI